MIKGVLLSVKSKLIWEYGLLMSFRVKLYEGKEGTVVRSTNLPFCILRQKESFASSCMKLPSQCAFSAARSGWASFTEKGIKVRSTTTKDP